MSRNCRECTSQSTRRYNTSYQKNVRSCAMEGLSVFLVLVSMLGFLICLVLLIINAIKKKPLKVFGVGMGLAVGVFSLRA